MAKLVIIRGLPGSGKSTLAKKNYPGFEHYETNMFFTRRGHYNFIPKLAHVAHKWCFYKVETALKAGKDVVVANTFCTQGEMVPYLSLASDLSLDVDVVEAKGEFGSVHNVPAEIIEKMKARWQETT